MMQPELPKPVFAKRKKSAKRRRRTEIPSPPQSPEKSAEKSETLETQQLEQLAQRPLKNGIQRSQHIQPPRRPRGRVVRAPNLPFSPVHSERPSVDYSAQSLRRLRDAQITLPPPGSTVTKTDTPEPDIRNAEPEVETTQIEELFRRDKPPGKSRNSAASRPAPFSTAWNPIPEPDEIVVDEEPDLAFLPMQEGSNSSDDGWEASQLARGGGGAARTARTEEQDFTHVIRRTEETPPTKGDITRLRAALKTARREWRARASAAHETANRATKAIETSEEIMRDAEKEIEDRKLVVGAYDDVLKVFRRVCECLRREKEAILGYRGRLLKRLDQEANQVKVGLLGGEDEFGRNVPGRLGDVDDEGDNIPTDDMETTKLNFDPEEMIDDVISALASWRRADEKGYKDGFGGKGGGRMIGRLGLAIGDLFWLRKPLDPVMREAALETGEVARLIGAEMRAFWEPRREGGLRRWDNFMIVISKDVSEAAKERFGWEVDACLHARDWVQAEKCVRGGLEAVRAGLDPELRKGMERLRELLNPVFRKEVEEEITQVEKSEVQVRSEMLVG